jgi:hypothetical protein
MMGTVTTILRLRTAGSVVERSEPDFVTCPGIGGCHRSEASQHSLWAEVRPLD